ncbi:hypothetical protein BD410DRAFT_786791 [Rickenella mellea]|uniref:N-acetyltransferase domain-containing protein n=1 Tax=Rickenella mellea TaxID=50990 RepID=A0A4Y7Q9Q5_9AGAM|nr:hypothetical protein BD410DRAFT_786791 [Rickenella mellea]
MRRKRDDLDDDTYSSNSEDEYVAAKRRGKKGGMRKRMKHNIQATSSSNTEPWEFSMQSLLDEMDEMSETSFDELVEDYLVDFLEGRTRYLHTLAEADTLGQPIRPLTRYEAQAIIQYVSQKDIPSSPPSWIENLVARKLKLQIHRRCHNLRDPQITAETGGNLTPVNPTRAVQPPPAGVLDALNSIQTTPFARSFAARLCGPMQDEFAGFFARDWCSRSLWMNLMDDIRDHHALAHPEREQTPSFTAPIDYQPLRPWHLTQLHALLANAFWDGIDVSDSFQYSPERCTVVATYKRLVIGGAFLSSPQETYITYLAVRSGWEGSQIATRMLYYLIEQNPLSDIILHVSANNSAMLLYNMFGFKAEEFIVGFYEEYLDRNSKRCKNAFRLRLQR